MNERYVNKRISALDAQRVAHEIAFGPIIFQVSRLMVKFGIFGLLMKTDEGLTQKEVSVKTGLSEYAAQVLLESSLTIGTVLYNDGKYRISKIGWFLENDPMVKSNMNFNQDVNYKGMFHLEESLLKGKPEGLKELGNWSTLYEGLASMDPKVRESWFGFDHYYSDNSFDEVLPVIFASRPSSVLDIGGNTGIWALRCVGYDPGVQVTVMDLPQQIGLMDKNIYGKPGAERIHGIACDILDSSSKIPEGFDIIWMSQFLDCFPEDKVSDILAKVVDGISRDSDVYILETIWDRQKYDTASFDLTQTSVYFTAIANGNSKMFFSDDLFAMIRKSGLTISSVRDGIGLGHSLIHCVLK
jgi:hypothetical protein